MSAERSTPTAAAAIAVRIRQIDKALEEVKARGETSLAVQLDNRMRFWTDHDDWNDYLAEVIVAYFEFPFGPTGQRVSYDKDAATVLISWPATTALATPTLRKEAGNY